MPAVTRRTASDDPAPIAERLVLHPAGRLLWRSDTEFQIEVGRRAVLVEGLAPDVVRRLCRREPAARPDPGGAPDTAVDTALLALHEAGYLWARPAVAPEPPVPLRLTAELAALRLRHGAGAAATLGDRRRRTVVVHGTGRLAAGIAAVLAAAGVGHIGLGSTGSVRLHAAAPGGVAPADEGRRFQDVAAEAVRRAAPEVVVGAPRSDPYGDLVVFTADGPTGAGGVAGLGAEDQVRAELHAAGVAHLVAACDGERGVVGPLVLPGVTSCLRCADLHRTERDRAWPVLAVQLPHRSLHTAAADVALDTTVTGLAAGQALAHLDGTRSAARGATIELHLPDWRLRRRTWTPHPDCPCGAADRPLDGAGWTGPM